MTQPSHREPVWLWVLAALALWWAADGHSRRPRTARTGTFGARRSSDEPRAVQAVRAAEPGRGRRATSPFQIPLRGWREILGRTFQQIGEDRVLALAAGVAFYSLLALFPAVTALVSLYGMFTDPAGIVGHLQWIGQFLPPGAFDIVRDQVERITSGSPAGLTLTFVIGLAVALWSANAATKAMFDALNVVYEEDEKRGFVRLNLVTLTFTLGAIVFFLLAVFAVVLIPIAASFIGFRTGAENLMNALRWPALLLVTILTLGIVYRFGPSRRGARWQWLSVGSLFAALAWLAVSFGFSWYLSNLTDYNAVYGSLGAVIGLLVWMWLSAAVVLVGAQLNAEIEHQTARDTTVGREKPLGARDAVMADSVGGASQ